jgi:hypothetical protein
VASPPRKAFLTTKPLPWRRATLPNRISVGSTLAPEPVKNRTLPPLTCLAKFTLVHPFSKVRMLPFIQLMTCGALHGNDSCLPRATSGQAAFSQRFPSKTMGSLSISSHHPLHELLELELGSNWAKMRVGHPPPTSEIHHRIMESHSNSEDLWAGRLRVRGIGALHRGVRLAWVTAVCKTHDRNDLPRMLTAALEERGLECLDEPEMQQVAEKNALPAFLGPLEDALKRVSGTQPVVLVNFESLMLGNGPEDG